VKIIYPTTGSKDLILNSFVDIKNNPIVSSNRVDVSCPVKFDTISTTIAVQHNLVLAKAEQLEFTDYKSDLTKLTDLEKSISSTTEFDDDYNALVSSSEYMISNVESEVDKIMNLFIDAMCQQPQTLDEVNKIVNDYIAIVEKSESLSEDDRKMLYSAFTVAAYSFEYWETKSKSE
jgi:hypothetical protein